MVEHSPTPWTQVELHPEIILANGQLAMHSFSIQPDPIVENDNPRFAGDLQEANAAFIVKAVNAHDQLTADVERLEQNAGIQAKLLADTARQRDALVEALMMARRRIDYLGAACTDSRHFEANDKTYLPKIDAVLDGVGHVQVRDNG